VRGVVDHRAPLGRINGRVNHALLVDFDAGLLDDL
jgi:hypothetical protein